MAKLENSVVYAEYDEHGKIICLIGKGKAKDFQRC